MEFSLTGKEVEETIGGVSVFKYPGRLMEQSGSEWTDIRRNMGRVRQVWGRLGVILRWEGEDPITSASFYRAVVQAVLLFGLETWILSAAMEKRIAGVRVGFLQQVTGKRANRRMDETWR